MPKLQFGADAYRIVGDAGEEGELVEYGMAAILHVGLHRYVAVVDEDGGEVFSLLPDGEWVVDGVAVPVEQEDVVFKGPGEGDATGLASASGAGEADEVDVEDFAVSSDGGEDDGDDDDLEDEDDDGFEGDEDEEDENEDDEEDEDVEIEEEGRAEVNRVNRSHARLSLVSA